MTIPKIIHQIHIGNSLLDELQLKWQKTWIDLHPEWDYILWDDEQVKQNLHITHPEIYNRCENYSEKSDILRFEILYQFGGLYIDTDFECFKPVDSLMLNKDILLFMLNPHKLASGFFAASKHNIEIKNLIDGLPEREKIYQSKQSLKTWRLNSDYKYGPQYVTDTLGLKFGVPDGSATSHKTVYPYLWTEMHRRYENFKLTHPEAYAAHHWYHSWRR